MLSRIKKTLRTRKQDTREGTRDRTTHTAIQAAQTVRNEIFVSIDQAYLVLILS